MASTAFPTRALTAALFTLLAWAANPLTTEAQLPDYLPTEGLVGWWPFNGNANDESGNGNDGTVNGATLTEDRDGNPNAAYSFDGVDDIISCAGVDAISGAQQLSVSIWFNTESMVGYDRLLGQEDDCNNLDQGFAIAFGDAQTQNLRILLRNGVNTNCSLPSSLILSGEWNNIIVSYNGNEPNNQSKCRLYLNGQIQDLNYFGLLPEALDVSDSNTPFQIGASSCNQSGLSYFFEGFIDDIAIYNRALTPEEVQALYTGIPYVAPCADPNACNFEQEGECFFATAVFDCNGNCQQDANNNGICDQLEAIGAQLCGEGTVWDNATGTCIGFDPCPADFNNSGVVEVADLLLFLAVFGENCD